MVKEIKMRIQRQEDNWTDIASATVRKLLQNYPHYGKNTDCPPRSNEYKKLDYPPGILNSAITCFMVLSILGIIGNLISYFALAKSSKLKYFTTSLLINISIVDLFISCLFALMLSIFFINNGGHYTDDICKVFAYIRFVGSMACMFMLTAIVFNRFVSVVWTRKYSTLYTSNNICRTIISIWIFPVTLLLLPLLGKGGRFAYDSVHGTCDLLYNNSFRGFLLFLIFILCPIIIVVCYVVMGVSLRYGRTCCSCSENPSSFPANSGSRKWADQDPSKDGSESRLLLFIFLIFAITLTCYVPVFFLRTTRSQEDYYVKHVLFYSLFFFSSAVKPAIYYAMSENYRKNYKKLFVRSENRFPDYDGDADIFDIQLNNIR